jgi:uncharacterized membrane protein YedE/YeeE
MLQIAAAFAAGLLFGAGLEVSRMVDPAKVLGFLDIAGDWDPSLAFVLAGAVATAGIGFRLVLGHSTRPLFAEIYRLPTARDIDRRLVAGAVLFGVGWSLVGLCPGPALANLGLAFRPAAIFVAAMLAGMALFKLSDRARAGAAGRTDHADRRAAFSHPHDTSGV